LQPEEPKRMLLENAAWSTEMVGRDHEYFARLSGGQTPAVCWIGCSDSRVSAETITNTRPGGLFVYRNIANLVVPDDNTLSVLEYAVCRLRVAHIIVCGHHRCGGVAAALEPAAPDCLASPLARHIAPLRALALRHDDELRSIADPEARADRLAAMNVTAQLATLRTLISRHFAGAGHRPMLHGWLYSVEDGRLRELVDPLRCDAVG
jgi:carbonic anhydrase